MRPFGANSGGVGGHRLGDSRSGGPAWLARPHTPAGPSSNARVTARPLPEHEVVRLQRAAGNTAVAQRIGPMTSWLSAFVPPVDKPRAGIDKTGFIDNSDGANIRTGPAESHGVALTADPIPPATRVFVS